jgi:hypothetical protein
VLRPTTVKLPFEAASWSAEHVAFAEATSTQAFAREVPPVAAPARPLSGGASVSRPGMKLAGALVESVSRRAVEVLLTRGGRAYRVPVEQVTFSGKDLIVGGQADALVPFYSDQELEANVR